MANSTLVESKNQDAVNAFQSEADRLRREHNELKARLSELNSRLYLNPTEEMERRTIQKLKLAKKDRIASLMVGYHGNS